MEKKIVKKYHIDGDILEVFFLYDEHTGRYFGEYPELAEELRYTPSGRRWVDVLMDECPYADGTDNTCGACSFMLKQDDKDIIGICNNEKLIIKREVK